MPYVQRDKEGNVIGVYAVAQRGAAGTKEPDIATENVSDDHQGVVAFRSRLDAAMKPSGVR